MIELYAIKPFALGAFLTWMVMRKLHKINKPRTFEIKEF